MSLADELAQPPERPPARRPRATHPKGFEPGVKYEANQPAEVVLRFEEIPETERQWREEIKRITKHTIPDSRKVVLDQVRWWGDPESPYVYCKFLIEDRAPQVENLDLEAIIKAARKAKTPRQRSTTDRALVVAWADLQVGKVGSRGGTDELVQRVMEKLSAVEARARELKCASCYLIDVGDCVESFENTPDQAFTNDLSFPEQLTVGRRLFAEAALRLARLHTDMVVAGVPSNHGRWRRGKANLGRPGDDFGLVILTAVADAFALNPDSLGHVRFVVPDVWQETIALDVHGTILAATHGHQVTSPDRLPQWWANQVHGGQPAADADILLTGHFHHLRVQTTGRSHHTGRSKWWIMAPTLDNGSDWWRLRTGSDSDPGLLTFTVNENGWSNLEVL